MKRYEVKITPARNPRIIFAIELGTFPNKEELLGVIGACIGTYTGAARELAMNACQIVNACVGPSVPKFVRVGGTCVGHIEITERDVVRLVDIRDDELLLLRELHYHIDTHYSLDGVSGFLPRLDTLIKRIKETPAK